MDNAYDPSIACGRTCAFSLISMLLLPQLVTCQGFQLACLTLMPSSFVSPWSCLLFPTFPANDWNNVIVGHPNYLMSWMLLSACSVYKSYWGELQFGMLVMVTTDNLFFCLANPSPALGSVAKLFPLYLFQMTTQHGWDHPRLYYWNSESAPCCWLHPYL